MTKIELRKKEIVHIAKVSFEVDPVIEPLKRLGCDRLYLMGGRSEPTIFKQYYDHIVNIIDRKMPDIVVKQLQVDVFDIGEIMSECCRIIRSEKKKGNDVYINLSSGGEIFAVAGSMAALMYKASAYYVQGESYNVNGKEFYKSGKPMGLTKGVRAVLDVPRYSLEPPRDDLIRALAVLSRLGGKAQERRMIEELDRSRVIESAEGDKKRPINLHMRFRRRILMPLLEKGWVEKEGRSRSSKVAISEEGRLILEIFEKGLQAVT